MRSISDRHDERESVNQALFFDARNREPEEIHQLEPAQGPESLYLSAEFTAKRTANRTAILLQIGCSETVWL